jgi:hypothetical protein
MWGNLPRVDWKNLHHAYGRADDAPAMLWRMVSEDPKSQHKGWDYFWGSLHHQGDYYSSTVAVVPYLIEAAANSEVCCRATILNALEHLWEGTANREGFPTAPDPPGGVDVPTPLLGDAEFTATKARGIQDPPDGHKEPDEDAFGSSRPMELCAWQTGRAVRAGQQTYVRLLDDPDPNVVRATASLLGVWAETREAARRALARAVEQVTEPEDQVRFILEFGKYSSDDIVPHLSRWLAEGRALEVRTAAALAWARAISPAPLAPAAVAVLEAASKPRCKVFPNMPQLGVYSYWGLPPNLAWLILRLSKNIDKELRWRMVQNFEQGSDAIASLPDAEVVPALMECLSDRYGRIRDAAAHGLAIRGPIVLNAHPDCADTLIHALRHHSSAKWGSHDGLDSEASPCGHVAHVLACGADRLTAGQRKAALARIKAASERFRGKDDEYVRLGGIWYNAHQYLRKQYEHLAKPVKKTLLRLLAEIAFPRNDDRFRPLLEADRDLADRYERSPRVFLASLRDHLRKSTPAGRGAVEWLRKLGPAAAFALKDLDAKAAASIPPASAWEIAGVARFIRWSRQFKSRPSIKKTRSAPTTSEWIAMLESPDVYTRAVAAGSLATRTEMGPARRQEAVTALQKLLKDDASIEFGVKGRCEVDGRLYFWRMERKTPRASAVTALFALEYQPADGSLFRGMVAESGRAAVVYGEKVTPRQFPLEVWRLAIQGAGGMSKCERLFSRLLSELIERPYSHEVNEKYACSDEVERVVASLTGRKS